MAVQTVPVCFHKSKLENICADNGHRQPEKGGLENMCTDLTEG